MDESMAIHALVKWGLIQPPSRRLSLLPSILVLDLVVLYGFARIVNIDLLVLVGLGIDYNANNDDDYIGEGVRSNPKGMETPRMRPRLVLELLSEELLVAEGVEMEVEMTLAAGMRLEFCSAVTPA